MIPVLRLARPRAAVSATPVRISLALLLFCALGSAVDAKLLSMLPSKSEAVGGVNLKAIANSGLVREFMKSGNSETKGLGEFIAMTGVDPMRDVNEIVFAGFSVPAPKTGTEAKPAKTIGVGFVTGNFDPARIGAAIVAKGGKQSTYKGRALFTPEEKSNKDGDVITFLDNSTMVAGNPAQVKSVLDKTPGSLSADLLARVNEVSGRYDLWMVSAVSPAAMAGGLSENTPGAEAAGAFGGDFFKKVVSTQGGIKLGPTINIGLEVISTTPEDATGMMNVLRFFSSMMASAPPKEGVAGPPPALQKMLSAIKMHTEAKTLFVTMDIAEADMISFLRAAQKKSAEQAGNPAPTVPEEITIIQ